VLIEGELRGLTRSPDGVVLRGSFLLEYPQRGKIVLHLLERGQHRLAVGGDARVVRRLRLVDDRTAGAAVEDGFPDRGAERPESRGGVEQVRPAGAPVAVRPGESHRRIV